VDFHQVGVNDELHTVVTLPQGKDLPVATEWEAEFKIRHGSCEDFDKASIKIEKVKENYATNLANRPWILITYFPVISH
jgi:hypothetical protein